MDARHKVAVIGAGFMGSMHSAIISGSFGVAQAAAVLILLIMVPLVPIIIGRVVAQPWSKK